MNTPETQTAKSAPAWARGMARVHHSLIQGFPLGKPAIKFSWVINFQKAGTFVFLGLLMWWYDNFSMAAWVYLALHGSYGLVWLIKDVAFPDPGWQVHIPLGGAVMSFVGVLGWYWLFGWLLISGTSDPSYPLSDGAWFALCISMCIIGCAIMLAADAQKYFTLKLQKGLITDGMFTYIRHPNYLGEILIYGSLGLMVWHWVPLLVLAWVWLGVFAVNMVNKEASMSRHPGWREYRGRTGWILPKLGSAASEPGNITG